MKWVFITLGNILAAMFNIYAYTQEGWVLSIFLSGVSATTALFCIIKIWEDWS